MMKDIDFNKKLLHPFFAGVFVVVAMLVYYAACYIFRLKFGSFDIEEVGVTEVLTYLFYGFAAGVASCFAKDFLNSPRQSTYFALMFLWLSALLREMGIQHWLTTHDSVVTKTRFFTNPANPLYEKIIAGTLMLLVIAVFAWVLFKNLKHLVSGFLKFQTIPWTVAVFGILATVTQIADRFPANYMKATGTALAEPVIFILKIFEEGGESLLPLLFALAFIQFHFILHRENKN